jgi:hypothetical protein
MEDETIKTNDKPWLFKKGNPGGPGRPVGKSLKEYSREYLACMTEEERQDFMDGISKETIWKMAEGNPDNKLQGDANAPITLVIKDINGNSITKGLRVEGIPNNSTGSTTEI